MLRDASDLDLETFSFAGSGERAASSIVDIQNGANGATATISDAHLLFNADFIRAGHDLILRGQDGGSALVRDYFASDERPALLSRDGAKLPGGLVEAMSGSLAPNQYAQAGTAAPAASDAVGRVVTSSGDASIIRNGVAVTLKPGDPVLRADVLQTVAGTMAVTFNDGSTLNLTANTRIVVSEFVYSPNGAGNSQLLDLVQGSLTFISGEVAHSGNMRIGTPVATMGIRGTVGGVTTANDGTVHFYVSQSATGAVIINEQGQIIANVVQDGPMIIVRPVGPLQVVAEEIQKTPAQLALELQALQQIVSIKAVGDQLLQQFFQQQNPNDPNPQSPKDQPHTQIQINLNYAKDGAGGDLPGGDTSRPFDDARVHFLSPNPDLPVTLPTVIDLAHANLPPVTFAPLAATMNEDQTLTFSGARTISVHDLDSRELTVTVSVTNGILSLASAAGLTFALNHGASGATLTFTGSPLAINAALHGMIFTPSADFNGAASLTITAHDGDSPAVTTSIPIDVAAVNDAPVLDYFNVNVAEGGTVTLTPADFHVTDPDGPAVIFAVSNVTGGYFMVGSGNNAQFSLFTAHTGPLTFTAEDIAAGRVKFVHDGGENPPTFTITVSDGVMPGTPVTETGTITQHVNDAPVLDYFNVNVAEGGTVTLTPADFHVTDPDGPAVSFTVTNVSGGHFIVTGQSALQAAHASGVVTFTAEDIAAGRVQFVHDGGESPPSFTIAVSDGTTSSTPVTETGTITEDVNDAPVLDYFNVNVAEGGTVTLTSTDFQVTDTDGLTVIFTITNVSGGHFIVTGQSALQAAHASGVITFTAEDIAAGRVQFVHDGGESPPSFTVTVSDGITPGAPVTETGTITQHVNDAPVLDGVIGTPVTYTENDCATVVNASLTISDVDSATLNGATVTIAANLDFGDVLSFTSHGGIAGSYNAQTGVLTLSGVASLADYQAVLRSVTYESTSNDPSDAPRTIEFQVDDGSAEHSASNVFSTVVDVLPENSAPVLSVGGHVADQFDSQAYDLNSGTASWTGGWIENENGDYAPNPTTGEIHIATDPSVSDTGFRLFLSDDDNEAGDPDTIQRTADLSGATSATLSFDYRRQIDFGDQGDVVTIWASDDGINFTKIGQIGSNGSAIVDQTYQHFSVDISEYISPTTTIRFSIGDGVDQGDWFYIDNVKIDYAGSSGSAAYVEGGSPVSIVPDGALIEDTDDTTLQSATVTLTNAQAGDLLSINGQLPAGIVASSYNAQTGVLTLSGAAALADYQSALAQIQFSNSGDNPGGADRTITVVVSDGSANSNTGTVTVHVTPVNDAPVSSDAANPATFAEDTDTVIPFSALLANASDPDGDTLSIVNVASSSAYGGTVTVNGTDITYHPAANFTGFDYFLYSVTDGHGGTIQRAATFTVGAVNDAPAVNANGASLNYAEDQTPAAIAPSIAVTDVDNTTLSGATVRITGNFSASEDVLGFINQNGISGSYNSTTGILALTGAATLAQYQAALASVTYFNADAVSTATRTISFSVTDGLVSSNVATVDVTVAAVDDTLNLAASAWAASGSIDLGGGVNVLNVAADGTDISAAGTPTVSQVDTGNLTGTGGTDSITLTGLQLDNIIVGNGKIDLGGGSGDTLNLKSTSADLNTLGATDAGIVGVEVISAAGAGAGVSIDVHGQSEAFTITGSANVDTLIGGSGADTINGGDGNDIITGGAGADHLNGGAGADTFVLTSPSDLTGDTIDGVHDNANDDTVRLNGAGTYDFSTAAVSNIDSVNIGVDAAGFNIVLTDEMASTAAYKGTNTAIEGRIRVAASTAVTNDVTIDASDLQAGHRLFVNAQNLGGNDIVIGGAGNDNIGGGAGNDTITGGAGNDDLTGGAGGDTFVFHAGFGADTISAFDETLDYLQFDQALFANVNALLAATTDNGTNTFIEYDASNKVTLQGVLKADLMAHTDHILIV